MIDPFDSDSFETGHPECVVAGFFQGWKLDLDITDPNYHVRYLLRYAEAEITIDGTYENNEWVFSLDGSDIEGWNISEDVELRWNLVVSQTQGDPNKALLETGFLYHYQSDSSRLTHAETMLRKIEGLLSGRVDADVDSYSIKDRSLTKMSIDQLLMLRDYYRSEIRKSGGSVSTSESSVNNNSLTIRFVS